MRRIIYLIIIAGFLGFIFVSSAIPQTIYITKSYFASPYEDVLDKAVQYAVAHDEAALKKLMQQGTLFILKPGLEVYLVESRIFSGKVKIRPRGQTFELWTVSEAITSK